MVISQYTVVLYIITMEQSFVRDFKVMKLVLLLTSILLNVSTWIDVDVEFNVQFLPQQNTQKGIRMLQNRMQISVGTWNILSYKSIIFNINKGPGRNIE